MRPVRLFLPLIAVVAAATMAPAACPVFLSNRSNGPIAVTPWLDASCTMGGQVLFRLRENSRSLERAMPEGPGQPFQEEQVLQPGATLELALETAPRDRHVSLFQVRRLGVPDRRIWNFHYRVHVHGETSHGTIFPTGFAAYIREVLQFPGPETDLLEFRQPAQEPGA